MADTVIIACRMLEPELRAAMEAEGADFPIVWTEKGLHDTPKKLTEALNERLREVEREYAPKRVLLGFGFCGNALAGVTAGNFELILPRIDDCITMLIGSRELKERYSGGVGTLFLTQSWVDSEESVVSQREKLIEDYGEDVGMQLFNMMYAQYGRIAVLDTRCAELAPILAKTEPMAAELGFEHRVFDASNAYLRELLTGPWSAERFIVKAAGETIGERDLRV